MSSGVRSAGVKEARRSARGARLHDRRQAIHRLGVSPDRRPLVAERRDGRLERLDFAGQRAGGRAEVAVLELELLVRRAKAGDFGAALQRRPRPTRIGQNAHAQTAAKTGLTVERPGDTRRYDDRRSRRYTAMSFTESVVRPRRANPAANSDCITRNVYARTQKSHAGEHMTKIPQAHVGSSPRNCSASATCSGVTIASAARSAIVRATRSRR